jgi:transmembrane sensor
MTISEGQAEEGGDALAREAAHWFARMRGPDADASRAEFEAWLARGPEHRAAYNDTAEVFAMGKLLAEPGDPAPAPPPRRPVLAMALATVAACVVGVGAWVATHQPGPAGDPREAIAGTTDHRRISAVADGPRMVRLADGSTVRLGDGTILDVDIASGQRSLRLVRGQARFEVAHEPRPFIVFAGGGSVTARGTIFEVVLARSGKVDVRLLQGGIDVAMPRQAPSAVPAMRRLKAGEGVSFTAQPDIPQASPKTAGATAVPLAAARDFEAVPVAELVAEANREAPRPIRLADASLGAQRVSGRFRVDDPELLARRLGALFGRAVDVGNPREIVLASASDEGARSRQN